MILPVLGINVSLPPGYEAVKSKLLQLGITPSGNPEIDKARLTQGLKEKDEKLEEQKFELEKLEKKDNQDKSEAEKLEEQRRGATLLAEQNKILLGL